MSEKLGSILEAPRQAITIYGNGDKAPQVSLNGQDINTLATYVLDVSENADSSLQFQIDNPEKCGPELRMLLARKAYNYASLEKITGEFTSLPLLHDLSNCDPQILESMGREIRDWLGVEQAPLGDVLSLLESKGVKILQHPFPSELSGLSAYSEEIGGVIFVNAKHPTKRKYSTALRELGHLICYRSEYGKPLSQKNREKEMAVNYIAGVVLLPRNVLEKELHQYRQCWIPESLLKDLKLRYQISMKMILIRATQVGLIQLAQKQQQCDALEKKYEITKLDQESPLPQTLCRLERLVYRSLLIGGISISKAAKILGKPLVEIHTNIRNCANRHVSLTNF